MNKPLTFFSRRSYALAVALGVAWGALDWVFEAHNWKDWAPELAHSALVLWATGLLPERAVHLADRVSRLTALYFGNFILMGLLGYSLGGPTWRRDYPGFLVISGVLAFISFWTFKVRRNVEKELAGAEAA